MKFKLSKPAGQLIRAQAATIFIVILFGGVQFSFAANQPQGSEVTAGNNASLTADNQINLLAAANTSSQASTNSSSSGSIGVSISTQGVSATASASKSKGKGDGQDLSYTNTQIIAGNTASITSGGDGNVNGAVVNAYRIKTDIGH